MSLLWQAHHLSYKKLLRARFAVHMARYVVCFVMSILCPLAASHAAPQHASLVIDESTGSVLHQDRAEQHRHPASLTKLMTLYLTFEAIAHQQLHWHTPLTVSARAAAQPRSHLGLRVGEHITVRDAVASIIVKSANDAAVVLAEAVAGDEASFAAAMNRKARALGMAHTHFQNASGLHHPQQVTTAYDMARLALALKKHYPQYHHLFGMKEFTYKNTKYTTHNRVLLKYPGATGLKTGFVAASGFNIVSSAKRHGHSIIAVVIGGHTAHARDHKVKDLMNRSFQFLAGKAGGHSTLAKAAVPVRKPHKKHLRTVASAKTRGDKVSH